MITRANPPQPSWDIAAAWRDYFAGAKREARRWAARLSAGQDPLTVGEQVALRQYLATLTNVLSEYEAHIVAAVMDRTTKAAAASLRITLNALQPWYDKAYAEALTQVGWATGANTVPVVNTLTGTLGALTADYERLSQAVQRYLTQSVAQALTGGESPAKLARRLSRVVDIAGRRGQARSLMIARTTLALAYDQANGAVYTQAAARGLITGYLWQARPGCCDVCAALNGTVMPADQPTYRHPNCRCVMRPVTARSAARNTPVGSRHDPFPDTQDLVDRLELHTSPSGWTNWRLRPLETRRAA